MARDYKGDTAPHERDGVIQVDSVERAIFHSGEVLLPTTRVSMGNGPTQKEIANGNPKSRIETEVMLGETAWGKFEPAIRRWESVLGRPAPAPTKPDGKDGAHRLSPEFTEWMMGIELGWVTEPVIGLTRNEMLKACGNGVVPQQAELALRMLLTGIAVNDESDSEDLLPTVMANSPMRNSRRAMVTHPTKRSGVALNQAIELMQGILPGEFESWDEVPPGYQSARGGQVMLPTPTVSDIFTSNLKSSQQKPGSMHSVTLPQAVERMIDVSPERENE